MQVYLVRHGETRGNVDNTDYGSNMELTANGRMQAEKIAERSKNIDFELLISSNFRRARETAEAVGRANNCSVEINDLFREYEMPPVLWGKDYSDPEVQSYVRDRTDNFDNPHWHLEGCENLFELKNRVKDAVTFLESRSEESIMVVSHSFFLRFFITYLLLRENFNSATWNSMGRNIKLSNTGLSLFTYEEEKWRLITWNDQAHFGE